MHKGNAIYGLIWSNIKILFLILQKKNPTTFFFFFLIFKMMYVYMHVLFKPIQG